MPSFQIPLHPFIADQRLMDALSQLDAPALWSPGATPEEAMRAMWAHERRQLVRAGWAAELRRRRQRVLGDPEGFLRRLRDPHLGTPYEAGGPWGEMPPRWAVPGLWM